MSTINSSNVKLTERSDDYYQEGITEIAIGHFASKYKKNMSLKELEKLAELAIKETSKASYCVSGIFDVIMVTQ